VNTDALNALKLAHKQALLGSIDEAMAFYVSNYDNNTNRKYEAAIKKTGLKQVTFSAAQTEKLNELAETVREDWIKDNSNSFNAQELFDFTQALVNE
ncbi:MAG: C4-dicarboxylate ABC transporter substrate-binding protein, partial [Arenicellales bacterium]